MTGESFGDTFELGPIAADVDASAAAGLDAVRGMWAHDHTVWSPDPTEITDRLGWLDVVGRVADDAAVIRREVTRLRELGVTDVLLVGMGGSSLYPMVLRSLAGHTATGPGFRLHVLDSTDPGAVHAIDEALPWGTSALIAASKSGSTLETVSHLHHFGARIGATGARARAERVLVITDPDSALDRQAHADGLQGIVHGQPDVGGRFSALTPFGMLPAALLGIDPVAHVEAAAPMLDTARQDTLEANAPAALGVAMASAFRSGRDKLVVVLPPEAAPFGWWIEQLVAESTGKHGVGLLPIVDTSADQFVGGADRFFVVVGDQRVPDHIGGYAPVVRLPWPGLDGLAGEVVRWEVATAVAGALMGINPFDQPDVARAKEATQRALAGEDVLEPTGSLDDVVAHIAAGSYLGLLGFVTPGGADEARMHAAAERLRAELNVPVTVGIGPRYLHSTGQLHKGGPATGVFAMVVGDDPVDVAIPSAGYTFGRLKRAQATGDIQALREVGRPVVRVTAAQLLG